MRKRSKREEEEEDEVKRNTMQKNKRVKRKFNNLHSGVLDQPLLYQMMYQVIRPHLRTPLISWQSLCRV